MSRLMRRGSATQSVPATFAVPLVGRARPTRILIVVVFPAPLGPMKPRICPRSTESVNRSSARQTCRTSSSGRGSPPPLCHFPSRVSALRVVFVARLSSRVGQCCSTRRVELLLLGRARSPNDINPQRLEFPGQINRSRGELRRFAQSGFLLFLTARSAALALRPIPIRPWDAFAGPPGRPSRGSERASGP